MTIDPMIEVYLYLVMLTLFPALIEFILLWFIIIPKPAKEITKGRLFRQALALKGHDTGMAEIVRIKALGEGLVRTVKGKEYNIIPRGDAEFAKKRHILRGTGQPVFVGYAGKSVIMDFDLLSVLDVLTRIFPQLEGFIKKLVNEQVKKEQQLGEVSAQTNALRFLDIRGPIKQWMGKMVTPATTKYLSMYSKMEGMMEKERALLRMVLILTPLIGVLILGFIMVYAMVFRGG